MSETKGSFGREGGAPPDEFVEYFDVFLYVIDFGGFHCVEDREWRNRRTVVDVASTGLDEPTDEQYFEQGVCIFEEFESRASLN